MTKMGRCLLFLVVAVMADSLPVLAETFIVVLKNGSRLETRYRPTVAEWDASKLLMMTAVGNRISLSRDDVYAVTANTEFTGYAKDLDATTIVIGQAPNDAPTPQDAVEAEGDILSELLEYLEWRDALRRPPFANVEQFVEPSVAGRDVPDGFPIEYLWGPAPWDPPETATGGFPIWFVWR